MRLYDLTWPDGHVQAYEMQPGDTLAIAIERLRHERWGDWHLFDSPNPMISAALKKARLEVLEVFPPEPVKIHTPVDFAQVRELNRSGHIRSPGETVSHAQLWCGVPTDALACFDGLDRETRERVYLSIAHEEDEIEETMDMGGYGYDGMGGFLRRGHQRRAA